MATDASGLARIDHIVVLMLENRSFDMMLGFLYDDRQNVSLAGQAFEGLTGAEFNTDASGTKFPVQKIPPGTRYAYYTPGADPGEHFQDVNVQLFGANPPPAGASPTCSGFVRNFTSAIAADPRKMNAGASAVLPGTSPGDIMRVFSRDMLPILSGLARGYAVCDHWFASVPTETSPNRAFACAATSQGHMDDATFSYTVPSIFGLLTQHGVSWAIYGFNQEPKARMDFPDTQKAPDTNFGTFSAFQAAAAAGKLASYTFLEPEWSSTGNSQHPNYDAAASEQLIHDVYYALKSGPAWSTTLLVVTYDEHGGCYDHVPPPSGATPPDATPGEFGFDFRRFGVRVPAVLVSPLIPAGTVFRVPAGSTPIDHTSILKTVQTRWNLPALTARDAAAPHLGGVLTLAAPRTDDPLQGVKVPVSPDKSPFGPSSPPSHLQTVHAAQVARLPVPNPSGSYKHNAPVLKTNADAAAYIRARTEAWKAAKSGRPIPVPAPPAKVASLRTRRKTAARIVKTRPKKGPRPKKTARPRKAAKRAK